MIDIRTVTLRQLVEIGYEERASDVCVKSGARPTMRKFSVFQPISDEFPVVDADNARRMIQEVMSEKQIKKFEDTLEMDLAFEVEGKCRIRANIYFQRGTYAIVMRIIPLRILTIEELGLPPVLRELCKHRLGLILFTGPTGSGKSTSLAAMIDVIEAEDPPYRTVRPESAGEMVRKEQALVWDRKA